MRLLLLVGGWVVLGASGCGQSPAAGHQAIRGATRSDSEPTDQVAAHADFGSSEPQGDPISADGADIEASDVMLHGDDDSGPLPETHLELRADGFYRAGRRVLPQFIVGLPEGVSVEAALAAGFDGKEGFGEPGERLGMLPPSGQDMSAWVTPHLNEANLLGWVGPDEPLWGGRTIEEVRAQVVTPLRALDATRPLILNHAPRGSQAEPQNFQLLAPWLALSDLVSMDIYPVPDANGHSILAEHPGLSAVGAHADLLRELVATSADPQPFFLVLQGAGLGRLPNERWEHLEAWTDLRGAPAVGLRAVTACDLDGDGVSALVLAWEDGAHSRLEVYDFSRSPFGERLLSQSTPADFAMTGLRYLLCADSDGDQRDDLLLLVDNGPTRQDFWVAASGTGAGLLPKLRYRAAIPEVSFAAIRHAAAGDVDGDGCADLVVSYDYPDGVQALLALPSSCQAFPAALGYPAVGLYATTVAELDLEAWPHLASGDFNGDGLLDLLLGQTVGATTSLITLLATGTGYASPIPALTSATSALDLTAGFMAAARVGESPTPALLVGQGASLRVLPSAAVAGTFAAAETWFGPGDLDTAALLAQAVGDFDGDGHEDVALAEANGSGGMRVRLATSTGRYFGARDPLLVELRYMWWSALAHGASAVVAWGQSFSQATELPWARLQVVAAETRALSPYFVGATRSRDTVAGETHWWVDGVSGRLQLLVLNETRARQTGAVVGVVPLDPPGTQVTRWSTALQAFVDVPTVTLAGQTLTDTEPLGPYEVRAYLVIP